MKSALFLFFCVFSCFFAAASAAPADVTEPVCVIKSNVSLRKGPGPKFPVSWAVPKYMPLLKLERKGAWLRVQDLDGQSHWVAAGVTSVKVSCAVVKTKNAKLRDGPSADRPLAEFSAAAKYTAFRKIDRDGEWVQVKDDFGGVFWVHETNVWMPTTRAKISF